jgi:hypothetical protein
MDGSRRNEYESPHMLIVVKIAKLLNNGSVQPKRCLQQLTSGLLVIRELQELALAAIARIR